MNYEETLDYLYGQTLAFHRIGSDAYKPGLERSLKLDELANNPHMRYKTIHVAGTNGKGSVAHLLAAVLQSLGHKVGLYTSPHLVDFSERIRVNGRPITHQYVIDFVGKNIRFIEREKPSFFELTTAMAFDYFRHKKVNFAVIETGMGGRLDSTNIITPVLSVITSISIDHTQHLGNTLLDIAGEKAGIIKRNIPVIVGDIQDNDVKQFLSSKAFELSAPILFATQKDTLRDADMQPDGSWQYDTVDYGLLTGDMRGLAQKYNTQTTLAAIRILAKLGVQIRIMAVRKAFKNAAKMTGLAGRWQEVSAEPKVICDIGHNLEAWKINLRQLYFESSKCSKTHIVIGISKDKEIDKILPLLPPHATYYFTEAATERAIPAKEIAHKGAAQQLQGSFYKSVQEAVNTALENASGKDLIFIGGSAFVVAEALPLFPATHKPLTLENS
jgi:dihydrofolate synthase/folylpolyglutamate synthase